MTELIWSGPASADIDAINAWLIKHASSAVAIRTLAEIKYRTEFLRNFPRGGRPFEDLRILRVPATPFLIFYRLEGDIVTVLRIRHEREDWQVET